MTFQILCDPLNDFVQKLPVVNTIFANFPDLLRPYEQFYAEACYHKYNVY